ncbi:MAG: hypothetical protein HY093_00800 [Candidatus Liptonbacteria bacterium]|nr:hypothetical protein [Candidatus Liptonbacteria bacterium]
MKFSPPPENFINQTPVEKASAPRGFYKSLVLDTLTVLTAALFSLSYYLFLNDRVTFPIPVLILIIFSILSTLEVLLIKSLKRRTLVLVLEALALFLFFLNLPNGLLVTAFGLTLFFLVWGEMNGRREVSNTLEPSYFRVSRITISKIVSALALMAAIIYFPKFDARENFISPAKFGSVFNWASDVVSKIYPEVNLNGTVSDFASKLAEAEIEKTPEYKNLPVPNQEKIKQAAIESIIAKFNEQLKIENKGSENLVDIAYKIVSSKIEQIKNQFSDQFRIVWTIILFLTIRSLGVILVPLAAGLNYLVIQLLLTAGFIFISGETRTKENLTL